MATIIESGEKIVRKDRSGVFRIGNTRVSFDSVIYAFNEGATAEEIVFRFPTIDLMQTYSAISYYLQNKSRVDTYLEKRNAERGALRAEIESTFSPLGIRPRLLARLKK